MAKHERDKALQEFIDRNKLCTGLTYIVRDEYACDSSAITLYFRGPKTLWILRHRDGHGWDILIPACSLNSTEATLNCAQRYLDLEDSHGK